MKRKIPAILLGAILALAQSASAVTFTLQSSSATKVGGFGNPQNLVSTFYQADGAGVDSGSAASLYSTIVGGNATTGWFGEISWGANPQPVLTSAFLKAGPGYLFWDSSDLAAFNAGTFDTIRIENIGAGGLKNQPGNAFLGTSHLGILGTPGKSVTITAVPDGGSTAALLGVGLLGLCLLKGGKQAKA